MAPPALMIINGDGGAVIRRLKYSKEPTANRVKATTCKIRPTLPTAYLFEYLLKLLIAANHHKAKAMIANANAKTTTISDRPSGKAML